MLATAVKRANFRTVTFFSGRLTESIKKFYFLFQTFESIEISVVEVVKFHSPERVRAIDRSAIEIEKRLDD